MINRFKGFNMIKMRSIFTSLLVVFALIMSGCGSDNSETPIVEGTTGTTTGTIPDITDVTDATDINESALTVLLPTSSKTVTQNGEQVSIEVKVFDGANNPYSDGEVKIVYPNDAVAGRDVGNFKELNVSITGGLATFEYTAPEDLTENTGNIVFGFYHSANPSDVKQYVITIDPEEDQTPLTTYSIKSSLVSGALSMGLESSKVISFYVTNGSGSQLKAEDIVSISMTVQDPSKAKFNYGADENLTTITMNNAVIDPQKESLSVNMKSFTKSGIVPIAVSAVIINSNDEQETINDIFNLIIFSGPPTAMSLQYIGTEHNQTTGKFQEYIVITATDKYFNRVNTNPAVSVSMIAGYAQEIPGNTTAGINSRIIYQPSNVAHSATIDPTNNTLTSNTDFSNVDLDNDILMTYGDGYTYNVSGNWNLDKTNLAMLGTNTLELADDIPGNTNISNIGFAIGHNYRQDTCVDGREWVGNVELESDVLDMNGMVRAIINYDYYLTGKKIALGVDIIGYNAQEDLTSKFGEMTTLTLHSTGLEAPETTIPANSTALYVEIPIVIKDGAGFNKWYRNANFSYKLRFSDNLMYAQNQAQINTITLQDIEATDTMDNALDSMSVVVNGTTYSINGVQNSLDAAGQSLAQAIDADINVDASYDASSDIITVTSSTAGTPFTINSFAFSDGGGAVDSFNGIIDTLQENATVTVTEIANGQVASCAVSPDGAGSGVAYIGVTVTEFKGETGTILVEDVVPSSEF